LQIFKKMLMLHTAGGKIAGWCGLNDGPNGAAVFVEVHGAPQGRLEAVLFTKAGEHALGTMEAAGRSAKGNWRYAGKTEEIEGIRLADPAAQYVARGGMAPALTRPVAKADKGAPKEPEAVPIPVVPEPAEKRFVMKTEGAPAREVIAREARAPSPEDRAPAPLAAAALPEAIALPETIATVPAPGTAPAEAAPPPAPTVPAEAALPPTPIVPAEAALPSAAPEEAEPLAEFDENNVEGALLARTEMRLYDGGREGSGQDSRPAEKTPPYAHEKGDKSNARGTESAKRPARAGNATAPSWTDAPLPLMEMPDGLEAEPEAETAHETDGEAGERDARIKTLLESAMEPAGEEAPPELPNDKEAPEPKKKTPDLIEVLSLSDVPRSGAEESALGEGSGKKGVLGKGAWWRVEQPGVDGWHYLAGELTAKNGARVRAIALEAECDHLPDHLRGWAQKVDDYFVVLIDAKTGAVLPDDAC
jgi:hypothetical protein